jgi:hypothetical protein
MDSDRCRAVGRETVVNQHTQRLTDTRNVGQSVVQFAHIEQAWVRIEQRLQDGALGEGSSATPRATREP